MSASLEQQGCDRGCFPHRDALGLGRVVDPRLHHIDVLVGFGVEAARDGYHRPDLLTDHGAG